MKKTIILSILAMAILSIGFYAFTPSTAMSTTVASDKIEWMTFEAALQANRQSPKPFFVNIYTDWCKWCKVMDAETFTNPEVVTKLNADYYPVKFNAEQRAPIQFKDKNYQYLQTTGRRGIHQLAFELLDQRAGYPSSVILSADFEEKEILKGYKKVEELVGHLTN